MPKAVVSEETEKIDLTSLEGAFVVLRKMSYGELQTRSDFLDISGKQDVVNGKKETRVIIKTKSTDKQLFDFSHAIVDHNLENEKGEKLDLRSPEQIARLDPVVGQEVEKLIDARNKLFDEDEVSKSLV